MRHLIFKKSSSSHRVNLFLSQVWHKILHIVTKIPQEASGEENKGEFKTKKQPFFQICQNSLACKQE